MKKDVGIIGFGNFGQFMAKHLLKEFNVFVTDNDEVIVNDVSDDDVGEDNISFRLTSTNNIQKEKQAREIGVNFTNLDEICKKEIIILAMPMENLEETLNNIKNKLKPSTLVLDVCSLKVFACDLMKKLLPENINIVGTHPLFGPQSAPNSIENLQVVLCNVRGNRLNDVKFFCEKLGLITSITTPVNHDKQMAYSQALTHFIGQIVYNTGIKKMDFTTKTFDDMMNLVDIIKSNTKSLFENMQTMNPYAKEIREKFIEKSYELDNYLNNLK